MAPWNLYIPPREHARGYAPSTSQLAEAEMSMYGDASWKSLAVTGPSFCPTIPFAVTLPKVIRDP